jgi:NADH:ubiquinone oxidoreductase subunit 5 (subunit L)/multisubunit Na+/H+ antiporter MnhA subunit
VLTFLGPPPASFGWALVVVGAASGIAGAVFALAQVDLKRLLAYSSVENVGIIALGLGVGLTGLHAASPAIAIFGFAGALLHLLNHAINKGLLFLGAGAVARAAGTREIERLGGLGSRMPATSASFLTGAAAISGLPPLNGFAGEFLIYVAAFRGATRLDPRDALPCLVALAGLALTGGLAAAGFTRAFGFTFLGQPRSEGAEAARDPGFAMRAPLLALASSCALLGLLSPWVAAALGPALVVATRTSARLVSGNLAAASASLEIAVLLFTALLALSAGLWLARRRLLAGHEVVAAATWGCGYASPSPRMQYTASSFAQPLTDLFAGLLGTRRTVGRPEGLFPASSSFSTETPDPFKERIFAPAFLGAARGAGRLRWLQQGQVRLYVAYIAATLLALLLWKLR